MYYNVFMCYTIRNYLFYGGYIMYVRTLKNGKYTYVYVNESYRENGKTKCRVVKALGRYDKLLNEDPNFMEKLKAQYEEPRIQKAKLIEQKFQENINSLNSTDCHSNDLTSNAAPLLCYGLEPVRAMWNNDLKLDKKIDYLQRQYTNVKFDINAAVMYLTGFKLLNPSSILGAYDCRHSFFASPANSVQLQDFYRALTFLSEQKEKIIKHLNIQIDAITERKLSMVFYDVTNAYFESPLTDEERKLIDTTMMDEIKSCINAYLVEHNLPDLDEVEKTRESYDPELMKLAPCDPYVLFNMKGELQVDLLPSDLYTEIRHSLFLKMRGLSKEHRFDLPLISIAMVIDDQGFPVDYEIYSGNSSEFTTMKTSIENIKQKYHIKKTVVVADRGLNSTDNLKMLLDNDYGFLVAQKITNLPNDFRAKMLEKEAYEAIEDVPFENYRYRTVEGFVKKKGSTEVNCKLIFTFSKEREKRDLKVLEDDTNRAKAAIDSQKRIASAKKSWEQMVVVKDTTGNQAESFNQKLYEKRRAECGYAAIVYSNCPSDEHSEITGKQIAMSYHQLVKIEECFRILKNNICLRPMFVYTPVHVKGYVMICYLALVCYRLFEYKLTKCRTPLSIRAISQALKNACIAPFKLNNELMFLHTSIYENLHKEEKTYQIKDELNLETEENEESNELNINKIMKACGLTPLMKINTSSTLNAFLKRKLSIDSMIDPKLMSKL